MFNNYGSYQPQKFLKANRYNLVQVYYNDQINTTVLGIYHRAPIDYMHETVSYDEFSLNRIRAAQIYTNLQGVQDQTYSYTMYNDDEKNLHILVVNPNDKSIKELLYRKFLQLIITTPNITEQNLTWRPQSYYAKQSVDYVTYNLKKYVPYHPKKSGSKWWIPVVVVGSVLVVGGIGFWYWKKKKRQQGDNSYASIPKTSSNSNYTP